MVNRLGSISAERAAREEERLAALKAYEILDTGPEQAYDDVVRIASQICGTPIALISLVDETRQWFKARVGLEATQTPRDQAFCAHAILEPGTTMVVPDASSDRRFATNPLVTEDPRIRFYAGSPLVTREGHGLGTLCVIDRIPRELTAEQRESLEALSRVVVNTLDLRRNSTRLAESLSRVKVLEEILPMCAQCKMIRDENDRWTRVDAYLTERTGSMISHGLCPTCLERYQP